MSSLSESDEEDQKSLNFNLTKRSDCDATKADVKESYPQQKFDKVSQAERDAAHNLVQLHLFGTINNKNSSNNVISSDNHSETTSTSSYSMPESRGYNMRMNQYLPKPEILLAQRMISTLSPFPPIHPSHLFRQEIQQQLMHAPTSGKSNDIHIHHEKIETNSKTIFLTIFYLSNYNHQFKGTLMSKDLHHSISSFQNFDVITRTAYMFSLLHY